MNNPQPLLSIKNCCCPSIAAGIGSSVRFCRMSFAFLPHSQIDALFEYLGPVFNNLRGACSLARQKSNGVELYLEIIKWYCTNPTPGPNPIRLLGFFPLGRIHRGCTRCSVKVRTRQMWRFPVSRSFQLPILCCKCMMLEVRLSFARNPQLRATCIIFQAIGHMDDFPILWQRSFLRALVDHSLPGPHFRDALRIFGSEAVEFAIRIDHA